MGLAVSVGSLADMLQHDRDQIAAVNAALVTEGVAPFTEATSVGESRCSLDSYPYTWLHYLRRVYAYHCAGQPVAPIIGADAASEDPIVMDETMMMTSHLLCHSDAEGFYVPVDFTDVIFADELPGQMLGSSHQLRRELASIAPVLGIELVDDELSDAEAARLESTEPDAPNEREILTWFSHWEAARLSIEHSSMIVYQ